MQEKYTKCKKQETKIPCKSARAWRETSRPGACAEKMGRCGWERDGNYASVLALAWLNMAALRSSLVVLFRCTAETR